MLKNDFGYFTVLRKEAAAFDASKPESRTLQIALLDVAAAAHGYAAAIFGKHVADYFRGDSVRPSDVLTACENLLRLTDFNAPPRARVTDAPVTTNSPLEARLAKLEFAELKRERVERASALWRTLKAKTADFDAFSYDGDDWTWGDIIRAGLVRATIIDWENPDKAGLKDLEAILRGDIGNPQVRQDCRSVTALRARIIPLWKHFDEYARAHYHNDDDLADAYDAGFDERRFCTLAQAMDDIEWALTAFERWGDRARAWHRKQCARG